MDKSLLDMAIKLRINTSFATRGAKRFRDSSTSGDEADNQSMDEEVSSQEDTDEEYRPHSKSNITTDNETNRMTRGMVKRTRKG